MEQNLGAVKACKGSLKKSYTTKFHHINNRSRLIGLKYRTNILHFGFIISLISANKYEAFDFAGRTKLPCDEALGPRVGKP